MASGRGHPRRRQTCLEMRTEREMEQAREKEVQAERFTSLDRTIERNMDESTSSTCRRMCRSAGEGRTGRW